MFLCAPLFKSSCSDILLFSTPDFVTSALIIVPTGNGGTEPPLELTFNILISLTI